MIFSHKVETQHKIKFKILLGCQLPIYEGNFNGQNEREHTSSVTAPGASATVTFFSAKGKEYGRGNNTHREINSYVPAFVFTNRGGVWTTKVV